MKLKRVIQIGLILTVLILFGLTIDINKAYGEDYIDRPDGDYILRNHSATNSSFHNKYLFCINSYNSINDYGDRY